MDYESFMDLVMRRRSYWHFRSDPVPDAYIEGIVDAARYAPSAFNCQLWEFVVLKDRGLRDEVTAIVADSMPAPPPGNHPGPAGPGPGVPAKDPLGFRTAPVFILVLGDTRVRSYGPPHIRSDGEHWESASTTSLAVAYEHMHLAAASLGLATRWVSAVSFPATATKIKELLGIPQELRVYEMMAVGRSDFEPPPKRLRSLKEVMHFGVCREDDFRSDADVAEYFTGRPK